MSDELANHREATEKETEDYLLGRQVFPDSVETEHGLLILDDEGDNE